MANANFRGWIWVNDGTASDNTGFVYCPGGLHGTQANVVAISNVYLWEGNNEWIAQFTFAITAANVKQGGWATFDPAASNVKGTRGDGYGIFTIEFPGKTYLFVPKRVFGYYDGSSSVTMFVTCNAPRIN